MKLRNKKTGRIYTMGGRVRINSVLLVDIYGKTRDILKNDIMKDFDVLVSSKDFFGDDQIDGRKYFNDFK